MLSRRVFLQSAFVMQGLSLRQRTVSAQIVDSLKILVLTEERCPDTSAFASYLPSSRIDMDPATLLQTLDVGFRQEEFDLIFGLSRDANYILIEQYAQASSYHLAYEGRHQYHSAGLFHDLNGDRRVVSAIKNQIDKEASEWTKIISQVPAICTQGRGAMVKSIIQTSVACPEQSPGHLVSWLFKRRSL